MMFRDLYFGNGLTYVEFNAIHSIKPIQSKNQKNHSAFVHPDAWPGVLHPAGWINDFYKLFGSLYT